MSEQVTYAYAPEGGPLTALAQAGAELIERVKPSVVQVRSNGRGNGTGVVWAPGVILTNDHVVAHSGGDIRVQLTDGRVLRATIGARSPELDLAVLNVAEQDLPAAAVGDSTGLRVGELVFAVGHPWGQPWVVTAGIVSGVGEVPVRDDRTAQYIRSDVRLAPGNSGGPLLNAAGEVVGINAMIFGGDLAVAIPSHVAIAWLGAKPARGPLLGVGVQPAELPAELRRGAWSDRRSALLVVGVQPESPAARAGVQVGDVLLDGAGRALESAADLRAALATPALATLRLYLSRGGAVLPLDVRLGQADGVAG